MTWVAAHAASERFADAAHIALRAERQDEARGLFRQAAEEEFRALSFLSDPSARTYGVTAVSAVALYMKSGERNMARALAHETLRHRNLPEFAGKSLRDLLTE